MVIATAEKKQEDFKPVETDNEDNSKSKKRAKKRTKLSDFEKIQVFEMFYNSDIENNILQKILYEIADSFNVDFNLILELYNDENWIMKKDERDFSLAIEYERKSILNIAKFKNNVTDFVSKEFEKIIKEYENIECSYFSNPNELIKFLKLVKDINNVDIKEIKENVYKPSREFNFMNDRYLHSFFNEDYNSMKKRLREEAKENYKVIKKELNK